MPGDGVAVRESDGGNQLRLLEEGLGKWEGGQTEGWMGRGVLGGGE